jgi:hypothetical protein
MSCSGGDESISCSGEIWRQKSGLFNTPILEHVVQERPSNQEDRNRKGAEEENRDGGR